MAYSKMVLIKKIDTSLKPLYQNGCINYTGVTSDTGEKYTEVISEYLCANIKKSEDDIRQVKRESPYKVRGHKWHPYDPNDPSILRKEERLARSMYGRKFGELEILDYQVPLKNAGTEENKGLGKIDLLAWDGERLIILELKRPDSTETLLRCILEAYTYWKTVDHAKLAGDYDHKSAHVRAAIMVFEGSQPHKDWMCNKQSFVKKLMEQLRVDLYVFDNDKNLKVTMAQKS